VVRATTVAVQGGVNTPKTIRNNRIRCLPWGPYKGVIKKNSTEQHSGVESSFETPVSRDMSLKLNSVESSELAAAE
jgi:hypothetical protein